jgi:hypothetical protein
MKLFDNFVPVKVVKPNKNKWIFVKELGITGDTDFITYLTFETDNERGYDFFKVRKSFNGIMKERKVNKNEVENKLVLVCSSVIPNDEGLEEICNDFERDFKTEEEMKEHIRFIKESDEIAIQKNKEYIFFDTRRYFWKYEDKKLKNLGFFSISLL